MLLTNNKGLGLVKHCILITAEHTCSRRHLFCWQDLVDKYRYE